MTTMCTTILFLILMTTFLQSAIGLNLEVNQPHYTEASKGPLQMTCLPDASDIRDQKHVMVLELGKEDQKPMAFISRRSGVSYGTIVPTSYQALGQIGENGGLTRLTVKIPNPTNEDSGHYSCTMYYFDAMGAFSDETAFANVTVNIVNTQTTAREMQESMARLEEKVTSQSSEVFDIHTLVRSLVKRVTELAEEAQISKTRTVELEKELKEVAQSSKTRVMELQHELLDLRGDFKNQTHKGAEVSDKVDQLGATSQILVNTSQVQAAEIAYISDIVSFSSAFSASLSTTKRINSDIVFDKIIMRQGDGYDNKTGIFTAPRNGTYAFHLVMMASPTSSDRDKMGQVDIKVDGNTVARLMAETRNGHLYLQSSASTVVSLTRGQQVKARCVDSEQWREYPFSVFTGYLIRAQ